MTLFFWSKVVCHLSHIHIWDNWRINESTCTRKYRENNAIPDGEVVGDICRQEPGCNKSGCDPQGWGPVDVGMNTSIGRVTRHLEHCKIHKQNVTEISIGHQYSMHLFQLYDIMVNYKLSKNCKLFAKQCVLNGNKVRKACLSIKVTIKIKRIYLYCSVVTEKSTNLSAKLT